MKWEMFGKPTTNGWSKPGRAISGPLPGSARSCRRTRISTGRCRPDYNPYSKALAERYFLKSAAAGYLEGMYAAFFTGEDRTGLFTPPETETDTSVTRKCLPRQTYTDEQVYWITKAASQGRLKSMVYLPMSCWKHGSSEQAYKLGEQYFHEASENGSTGSTNWLINEHSEPRHQVKPNAKKLLYYAFLNFRYYDYGDDPPPKAQEEMMDQIKENNVLRKQASSLTPADIKDEAERSGATYARWQRNFHAAQRLFYLAPHLFDRVQVWAVGR